MTEPPHPNPSFRVIIVGGAIAGLTLAHCLIRENIDFIVLESHAEIAPQAGASIGILANGFRVLDQLGLFDDVFNAVEPLTVSSIWTAEGKPLFSNTAPEVLHKRHGYPFSFLNRQTLLAALYRHLGSNQQKVLVSKKLVKVNHVKDSVVVECCDGSSYTGDLLVGADGVHSVVRTEMWKRMIDCNLEDDVRDEKNNNFSFLTVAGKNGDVYWFLFAKMDRRYSMSDIPRFDSEQHAAHVAKYMDQHVAEGVKFGAVYQRVIKSTYIPLEEAFIQHWFYDRMICIGDAVHKMTPNMGQGANSAIESVASLTNYIRLAVNSASPGSKPSPQDMTHFLSQWQGARQPRAKEVWQGANDFTRLEAFATPFHKLFAHYLMPLMGDKAIDMISDMLVGGEILESLKVPDRSLRCSIPYNPQFERLKDILGIRSLLVLPLVICALASWYSDLFPDSVRQSVVSALISQSTLERNQAIPFILNLGITITIFIIEGYRHSSRFTLMALPAFFAALSLLKGPGKVAPAYFALYLLHFPLPKLIIGPSRQVNTIAINTVLPTLVGIFGIPLVAIYTVDSASVRMSSLRIWQFCPFALIIVPRLVQKIASKTKGSTANDLPNLRIAYGLLAAITIIGNLYIQLSSPSTHNSMNFLRQILAPASLISSVRTLDTLQRDNLIAQTSAFIWLAVSFRDFRRFGLLTSYVVGVMLMFMVTWLIGPETAIVMGLIAREELLVKFSHRG